MDLKIKKGEFVGIFGDSGSGKSTLADLLLGFFQPNNGNIIIDGERKKITPDFWKTKIGYSMKVMFGVILFQNVKQKTNHQSILTLN